MPRPSSVLSILLLTLVSACSVPLHSSDMWSQLEGSGGLELEPGRAEIAGPIRVGIAPPLRPRNQAWDPRRARFEAWTEKEREVIDRWSDPFVETGAVEEMVYLPRLLVYEKEGKINMRSLNAAARRADVDAVLVIHELTDVGQMVNPLAILDLSLVGAFVFPGHSGKAVTVAEAVVFEVATNRVYAFAQGEGEASTMTALAYLDEEELSNESRLASLEKLGKALTDAIRKRTTRG